jgi:hypothetical protein
MILSERFELEDAVIELHNIARNLQTKKEFGTAKLIRQMADEVSDKIKKVK